MKISGLFNISNGKSIINLPNGQNPIYGSTGVIGSTSCVLCSGSRILIARVGMNCGYVQFVNGNYWVSDNTLIACAKENLLPRYGYYLLLTLKLQKYRIGAAQPLLTIGIINSIDVKYHKLSEQNHIVNTISFLLLKSL